MGFGWFENEFVGDDLGLAGDVGELVIMRGRVESFPQNTFSRIVHVDYHVGIPGGVLGAATLDVNNVTLLHNWD